MRKLTQENREIANQLRQDMLAAQRAAKAQLTTTKKKAQGSARGSEERQTSVSAAAPRGQKRMRDHDLEKVSEAVGVSPVTLCLHNTRFLVAGRKAVSAIFR
jgi:hypothetical protein